MKLDLVKRIEAKNTEHINASTALNEEICIFLTSNKDYKYELLVTASSELITIARPFTENSYDPAFNPVLFSMHNRFGIIKNKRELLFYSELNSSPETIRIQNQELLPDSARLHHPNPISDSDILPICFEDCGVFGEPRHMAFLNVDTEAKTARWESHAALEATAFAHHKQEKQYPPKLDSLMLKNGALYAFTSGGKLSSIGKWGMDYYALVKCETNGIVKEKLIDSGDLHAIDQKKRGVNGLFSSCGQHLILTPVFQSDEWKGKQKIYLLGTNEISDITLPRGLGKYSQIVQCHGSQFWIFMRDSKEIAICRKN